MPIRLTARYGTTHGIAIAVMLPHVVRWNSVVVGERYGELLAISGHPVGVNPGDVLAARLERLARAADLPATLSEIGARRDDLGALAADAATQWTGHLQPANVRCGRGSGALQTGVLGTEVRAESEDRLTGQLVGFGLRQPEAGEKPMT